MSEIRDLAYQDYKAGMKYQDIADKYNVSLSTVKSWATRHWKKGCDQDKKVATKKEKKLQTKVATSIDNISWINIENEYVTDIRKRPCSLEDLAKKYSISKKTLEDHCKDGEWVKKRDEYRVTTGQKVIEKTMEEDSDRIARLLRIADKASEKAEQALDEIESYIVKNKKKTKTVEYKDATAIGKPTKEVIEEIENMETVQGPVDRQGLLFVTNALKNIKDMYGIELADEKMRAEIALLKEKSQSKNGDNLPDNMQTLADIVLHSRPNRKLEDYE